MPFPSGTRHYGAAMGSGKTWSGGANLPTRNMRVNATRPLACLSISSDIIEIRLRLRLLARLIRADELSAKPDTVECVYRAVGRLFRGVGVRTTAGCDYYFRTRASEEILASARAAGFHVIEEPRVPSKIWKPVP